MENLPMPPWNIPFRASNLKKAVMDGFFKFLTQTPCKRAWTIYDPAQGEPDLGYLPRRGKANHDTPGATYDRKHLFHYRPDLLDELTRRGIPFRSELPWIKACGELFKACQGALNQFIDEQISPRFPQTPFRSLTEGADRPGAEGRNILRLIVYFPAPSAVPGTLIAKPHQDRSAFTLHVDENEPGLHTGKTLWQTSQSQALIFPGKKAWSLTQGKLAPLTHHVEVTSSTSAKRRTAIVYFAHTNTAPP